VPAALVIKQPDLGTALLVLAGRPVRDLFAGLSLEAGDPVLVGPW
jgi:cell division protein FtsW (lipid II flippase)